MHCVPLQHFWDASQQSFPQGLAQLQAPDSHVAFVMHFDPQPPQLLTSVCVYTSQPSDCRLLLQFAKNLRHEPTHLPSTQPPESMFAPLHVTPHAPQLDGLVLMFVSQPLPQNLSQSAKPESQLASTQLALLHPGAALGYEHTRSHSPQLSTSESRTASHPFLLSPSQLPRYLSHMKPHRP